MDEQSIILHPKSDGEANHQKKTTPAYPSSKLTWQWNIPILNREYIFQQVHFPLPC